MDYIDNARYKPLEDVVFDDEEFGKPFRDITTAFRLSDAIFRLHIRGLIYCDLSLTNIWMNAESGEIKIIDNDNIIFSNEASGIGGTKDFQAPEVILQELASGRAQLSADTDRHSLVNVLFHILFHGHPFRGQREIELKVDNDETATDLFGKNPIFIYDPSNTKNRPNPEVHAVVDFYWPQYPPFIRELFIKTFTNGLKDPVNGRIRESIWRKNLLRLRDSVIRCSACGADYMLDADPSEPHHPGEYACSSCGTLQKVPKRLIISGRGVSHGIYLNENMYLYQTHIDNSYNIDTRIGQFESRTKGDIKMIGIRNISQTTWSYAVAGKQSQNLAPGKAVVASADIQIQFPGGITGTFTS
jgi:eukaryotic-like serine/threonine-protein kinase